MAPKRNPKEDGRIVVADANIPSLIAGSIGIYFEWTTSAGYTIIFVYVYAEDNIAFGEILIYNKRDVDLIRQHGLQLLVTMQVTQSDPVKSAARQGGLRPSGEIVQHEVVLPYGV